MKEKFIENGIEYLKHGDYYFPNLAVPNNKEYNIGKYGRLHAKFIKENRPCFYTARMIDGTWLDYLEKINNSAKEILILIHQKVKITSTSSLHRLNTKQRSINGLRNRDAVFVKTARDL